MGFSNPGSISVTDQLGRPVSFNFPPQRIISLVPSQTELLFDLGLDARVVGITKFCMRPESWFKTKTRIGGTKSFSFEKIKSLQPDLIIGNKEENEEQKIHQLISEYPVWMSDIKTLEDALQMIMKLGQVTNTVIKAANIAERIRANFGNLKIYAGSKPRVAYAIWYNPLMVAGSDTFIDNLLQHCGFENAFAHLQRYPVIDDAILRKTKPDIILLSSEPFPFKQKQADELHQISNLSKIIMVNGEYFSWYGSRLIHAPAYFESVLPSLAHY